MIRRAVTDYQLVLLALLLSLFGLAMVYSAGQTDAVSLVATAYRKQFVWLLLGLTAMLLMSRASVRVLEWVTIPGYILMVGLLVATLLWGGGAGTAASSNSWIGIGGLRIQPSEFAKIVVVLMLAKVLASRRDAPRSLLDLWQPAVIVLIPWVLIMLQPDLGTGIAFIGIFFAMLYWAGVSWPLLLLVASPAVSLLLAADTRLWGGWFALLVALVIYYRPYVWEGVALIVSNVVMGILAPVLWNRLSPYRQNRLLTFLDNDADPLGSAYHVRQSQTAIGSGGWFGQGFTDGSQKRLGFLPEQHTDFIFAVTGEELGFIGVAIALAFFMILFLRTTRIASRANEPFSGLVAFGLTASWFVHVLINVGMTLNLMPVTGIPLPFFSYGGSFMLASWIAVGILLRISSEGRGRADALVL
jgi:rod shape determining protein RodA